MISIYTVFFYFSGATFTMIVMRYSLFTIVPPKWMIAIKNEFIYSHSDNGDRQMDTHAKQCV